MCDIHAVSEAAVGLHLLLYPRDHLVSDLLQAQQNHHRQHNAVTAVPASKQLWLPGGS